MCNMIRILAKQRIGFNIVHINAQSLTNLGIYLFKPADVDFICVSETRFPHKCSKSVFNLRGFKLFRSDRRILNDAIETRDINEEQTHIGSEIENVFLDISTGDNKKLLPGIV